MIKAFIFLGLIVGLVLSIPLVSINAQTQQPDIPGVEITTPGCVKTSIALKEEVLLTGLSGGAVYYLDTSATINSPTDAPIQFFGDPDMLTGHQQLTIHAFSLVDVTQKIQSGAPKSFVYSFCTPAGSEELRLVAMQFQDDSIDPVVIQSFLDIP